MLRRLLNRRGQRLVLMLLLAAACAPAKPAADAPAVGPTTAGSSAAPAAATPGGASSSAPVSPRTATASMPKPLDPPLPVRVGLLASIVDAGVYIGYERGYYRDLGLDLELEVVPDPNTLGTLTSTNQVQVGGTGIIANVFQAAARNIGIKMVADKGQQRPGFGYFSLVARADLLQDGQLRSFADLKGRTVARLAPCDSAEALWQRVFERGGLAREDVEFVYMAFPDMNAALANRAVDAAFQLEPLTTLAAERGISRTFAPGDEIYPNQQLAAIYYSPEFAANTDAAQRFMVAYVRSLRDYNDAFAKGIGRGDAAQILAKHTPVKDLALYEKLVPGGLDPDGRINVESVREDMALQGRLGCVPGEVADVSRVIDESFVNYAGSVLGPYQR